MKTHSCSLQLSNHLALLLLALIPAVSCSSIANSPSIPGGQPVLEIAHSSGSDAPILTYMTVWEDHLGFEILGRKMRVSRASRERVALVETLLQRSGLNELESNRGKSAHEPVISLKFDGSQITFLSEDPPEQAQELLAALHELFQGRFRRYESAMLGSPKPPQVSHGLTARP